MDEFLVNYVDNIIFVVAKGNKIPFAYDLMEELVKRGQQVRGLTTSKNKISFKVF